MSRGALSSLILGFSILLVVGCNDNDIEGASTTTVAFKVDKIGAANTAINTGQCTAAGKTGTAFIVTIDYSGVELITGISLTFTFFTNTTPGTTGSGTLNPNNGGYINTQGSAGGFRSVTTPSNVKITPCIVFGTATSITYNYTITTNAVKTYTTSVSINKPTGAN